MKHSQGSTSFCCLNGGHRANQSKLKRSCRKDGCTRKHNRLLHRDGNYPSNSHSIDSETNPVLTVITCNVILQVVSVQLSNGAISVETLAVCDTGSAISFIHSGIKSLLGIDGTKLRLSVASINGTKDMTSEKVSVKVSTNNHAEFLTFPYMEICTSGIAAMIIHKSNKNTSI